MSAGSQSLKDFCDEFTVKTQTKRENVMTWDEYFMSLAIVTSMRSKDPCMQVGACIVNAKNRVIALGYNGFPDGLSDEDLPWTKFQEDPLQNKNHYGCFFLLGFQLYFDPA
ncbi:unnamed protein product [Hymenolepis diminuta]|uniref:dCMP deaminase n=1 Tax=Hymenolepis diminuta TaxID=6216 RepID=A0A564YMB9_HYMDI|nr:unnamed protein product [Hymenolepis diminuta]